LNFGRLKKTLKLLKITVCALVFSIILILKFGIFICDII